MVWTLSHHLDHQYQVKKNGGKDEASFDTHLWYKTMLTLWRIVRRPFLIHQLQKGSNNFLSAWLCIINGLSKLTSPWPQIFLIHQWRSRWRNKVHNICSEEIIPSKKRRIIMKVFFICYFRRSRWCVIIQFSAKDPKQESIKKVAKNWC